MNEGQATVPSSAVTQLNHDGCSQYKLLHGTAYRCSAALVWVMQHSCIGTVYMLRNEGHLPAWSFCPFQNVWRPGEAAQTLQFALLSALGSREIQALQALRTTTLGRYLHTCRRHADIPARKHTFAPPSWRRPGRIRMCIHRYSRHSACCPLQPACHNGFVRSIGYDHADGLVISLHFPA